jgi:glycosyltransferase 2 family protein
VVGFPESRYDPGTMRAEAASGRWLRAALLLGGATLFALLVWKIGPRAIALSFGQLGWTLAVVIVFPFCVITAFDTLGWRYAFRRDRVSFWALARARMAGEAVNGTTPTGSIGGEALKAWLIRDRVPFRESLPSVIVAKTTITIAQALFLLFGILTAWPTLPTEQAWLLKPMLALLGLEMLAVGGFVYAQVHGVLAGGGRMLERIGVNLAAHRGLPLKRMDRALSIFYRRQPTRLALSIGFHFLGWVASAAETWFILWLLGVGVSPATAVIIEACGTAVRFITFFIPGHLGALEGGNVAVFMALGLDPAAAVTAILVRRVREAAWIGLGFAVIRAPRRRATPVEERHGGGGGRRAVRSKARGARG